MSAHDLSTLLMSLAGAALSAFTVWCLFGSVSSRKPARAVRWEYRHFYQSRLGADVVIEVLDDLGQSGWEVFAVERPLPGEPGAVFWMKRSVEAADEG